jgi:hypothetical protein
MIPLGTTVQAGHYKGIVVRVIEPTLTADGATPRPPLYEIQLNLRYRYSHVGKQLTGIPTHLKGEPLKNYPPTPQGTFVPNAAAEYRVKLYADEFSQL